MLSEEDKIYVTDKLVESLVLIDKPRGVLTSPFTNTDFPLELIDGTARIMAGSAVGLCIKDGWNHDPIWLQLLLDIFELRVVDLKIAEIWERSRHKPPPGADPLAQTILNNSIPFVNRFTLRGHLVRLETPAANGKPILVVNGNEKSGKSYSTNYIAHYSSVRDSVVACRKSLEPETEMETSAEKVARDLVGMMGRPLNTIPAPVTNLKRYCSDLALWILNEAAQTSLQHWFVLDNFKGANLRQDTKDLLIALSDLITTGVFSRKCRLILIGFDRALLTVDPGRIEEEIIKPCTRSDVETTVKEILQRAPSPLDFTGMMDYISTGLPPGSLKMEELNQRLRVLLYAIINLKGILSDVKEVDFEAVLREMLKDLPAGKAAMEEMQKRLSALEESKNDI